MLIGLVLGYAAIRFRVKSDPIVDQIDALLPQTQCGQCTYPGCRPYAEAMAAGEADINQCPPGGEVTIQALADLLGVDAKPLNAEHGEHSEKTIVTIDEQVCIGCTLCIRTSSSRHNPCGNPMQCWKLATQYRSQTSNFSRI